MAADPLHIDQVYHNLLGALSEERHEPAKLQLMADCLGDLLGQPEDRAYSYVLQLGLMFLSVARHIDLEGEPPERIDRFLEMTRAVRDRLGRRFDPAVAAEAAANLLHQKARQCFYLGNLGRGSRALALKQRILGGGAWDEPPARKDEEASPDSGLVTELERRPTSASNFEVLREFAARSRAVGAVRLDIEDILEKWRRVEEGVEADSLNTLLVEADPATGEERHGRVLPLTVQAKAMAGLDNQPLVHFNNASLASRNELLNVAQDAVAAAEVLGHREFGRGERALYFNFSFPDKGSAFAGRSIGLALALLSYNQNRIVRDRRSHLKFRSNCAVTGNVSLRGELEAARGRGLRMKIEAAFFSHLRTVIVPREVLAEARGYVHELASAHPRRRLGLVPADSLAELVGNKDLCAEEKAAFLGYALRHASVAFRYGATLIVGAGLMAAAIFVFRHPELQFWKERTPGAIAASGDTLVVRNKEDQVIWKFRATGELNPLYGPQDFLSADINDDGHPELICTLPFKGNELLTSPLYCFSDRGRLLWDFHAGRKLRTRGGELISDKYYARAIATVPLEPGRGQGVLIGAMHSPWYAYHLALLDAQGRKLGEFWNSGHFDQSAVAVADLNGDGSAEIIIGGQNNGYDSACLAVLDPQRMEGASPQKDTPRFEFLDLPPGTEKYYLLLPPSPLSRLLTVRNRVSAISIDREARTIEVLVVEHREPYAGGLSYILRYLFDYDFRVLSCKPEDYYTSKLRELRALKVMPEITRDEIASWKDLVLYWDGTRWTTTPTPNLASRAVGR